MDLIASDYLHPQPGPASARMLDLMGDRLDRMAEFRTVPDDERPAFDDPAGDDEFGRDDR